MAQNSESSCMSIKSVSALVALFLFVANANAEINVEVGPAFLSGEFSDGGLLLISDRVTPKWELSLAYISDQLCNGCTHKLDLQRNLGIGGTRIGKYWRFEFGLGAAYFTNINRAFSKNFTVHAMLAFRITDRLSIRGRHWSNAGTGETNLGQDAFTIAWSFQ